MSLFIILDFKTFNKRFFMEELRTSGQGGGSHL